MKCTFILYVLSLSLVVVAGTYLNEEDLAPVNNKLAKLESKILQLTTQVQKMKSINDKHVNEILAKLGQFEEQVKQLKGSKKSELPRASEDITEKLASQISSLEKQLSKLNKPSLQTEAMELGGAVSVDFGADPEDVSSLAVEVGTVELSANVNIADNIIASVTVLAEGNLSEISLDQALVEWSDLGPLTLVFGQQTYNHALLSTYLISDPVLLDHVETAGPGLTTLFSFGNFSPGIGITFVHEDEESEISASIENNVIVYDTSIVAEETNLFKGIINLDYSFLEESVARLSFSIYGDVFDIALGTGITAGPVIIDLEGFLEVTDDDDAKLSGFYTGVVFGINDNIEAAFRYDGLSEDMFSDLEHRIGVGATFSFNHGLFAAMEYGRNIPAEGTGSNEISLQLGLESTLKLPGFHRKTLIRD